MLPKDLIYYAPTYLGWTNSNEIGECWVLPSGEKYKMGYSPSLDTWFSIHEDMKYRAYSKNECVICNSCVQMKRYVPTKPWKSIKKVIG